MKKLIQLLCIAGTLLILQQLHAYADEWSYSPEKEWKTEMNLSRQS